MTVRKLYCLFFGKWQNYLLLTGVINERIKVIEDEVIGGRSSVVDHSRWIRTMSEQSAALTDFCPSVSWGSEKCLPEQQLIEEYIPVFSALFRSKASISHPNIQPSSFNLVFVLYILLYQGTYIPWRLFSSTSP